MHGRVLPEVLAPRLAEDLHGFVSPGQRGFTLIELLVVLLLIGIASAALGLSLNHDPGQLLHEDAKRLALLLRDAEDEARLDGRVILWQADAQGYRFLRLEHGQRRPSPFAADHPLRARAWRAAPVRIDGQWPTLDAEWLGGPARIELSGGQQRISLVRSADGRITVRR